MAPRFCPFCGQTNDAAYSFCQRCGKPLPALAASSAIASASLSQGVPPPPPDEPRADDGPVDRPLTDAERRALRNSRRARLGNMARVFGTLTGIVPPFFVLLSFLGTPFPPLNYMIVILVAAVLALILGGASLALRLPIMAALRAGQVTEARGVPEKRPGAGGLISVDLGGVDLQVKENLANRLLDGRMNEVAFVLAGPGGPRHADRAHAAVIAVNGDASSPANAFVLVPPDILQALRPGKRGALARRA